MNFDKPVFLAVFLHSEQLSLERSKINFPLQA